MANSLKILFVASECVPFAKTGGLADVVGSLPKALHALGHDVRIVLPKYASIDPSRLTLQRLQESMCVRMGGGQEEWCAVDMGHLEKEVPVYFIESWKFFGRPGIYNENNIDYTDNPQRFAFLCRAALQMCIDQQFQPDIVHVHDWPTALTAAYLKIWHGQDPVLSKTASVLTIHNMQYQGVFSARHYEYIGLGWQHFHSGQLEDHGRINFLKGGIFFADALTTVSPTYAEETRHSDLGAGMQSYLRARGGDYAGILNGVDYEDWDPASDPLIPANYTGADLSGKARCKEELQRAFQLEVDPGIPIVGVVSRFAGQKGLDLLYEAIHRSLKHMRVQFVILGSGDKELEWKYMQLPSLYPGRVGSFIGYDNRKAHWIEAGADFFIMPSHYEPCGLNQLYSLKYGTLPIVRSTGGLADTVEQYEEATGQGTGFKYRDNNPGAIADTVGWAVSTFYDRHEHFLAMQQRAMQRHFGWEESARKYVAVYLQALAKKRRS